MGAASQLPATAGQAQLPEKGLEEVKPGLRHSPSLWHRAPGTKPLVCSVLVPPRCR